MMLGIMTDQYPTQAVAQFFNTVAAGIPWTRFAHDEYHKTVAGLPLGYMSEPYASKRLFALDPSESRGHGWSGEALEVHFPRNIYNPFPMSAWRFMGEMNAAGELRGFARLGGDFFAVKNARGRRVRDARGTLPQVRLADAGYPDRAVAPGKAAAVPTARFQVLREGLQECEARIAIDKALVSADKRIKLGPALAAEGARPARPARPRHAPRREHPAPGSREPTSGPHRPTEMPGTCSPRCLATSGTSAPVGSKRPRGCTTWQPQWRRNSSSRDALPDAAVRDHPGCMREDQYESTPYPDVVSLAHEIRRSNGRLEEAMRPNSRELVFRGVAGNVAGFCTDRPRNVRLKASRVAPMIWYRCMTASVSAPLDGAFSMSRSDHSSGGTECQSTTGLTFHAPPFTFKVAFLV